MDRSVSLAWIVAVSLVVGTLIGWMEADPCLDRTRGETVAALCADDRRPVGP
jgi:hypothetical protein